MAAVKLARERAGRREEWDARLETSAIAVLAYLWRLARGQKWAGPHGSAWFAWSLSQLVAGLAPIMGWEGSREQLLRRHRKSVQRWLDWLALAGLVEHTPQQDEEGFWWRTVIRLRPLPEIPVEVLEEAVERRRGWPARERRRETRGLLRPAGRRVRNLTAILRRARLSRAERRRRAIERRRACQQHSERIRVREAVQQSLVSATVAGTTNGHLTHPFGASTTSRSSFRSVSNNETPHRGIARAGEPISALATDTRTSTTGTEKGSASGGEELRWAVYREVVGARLERSDDDWEPFLQASARRVRELLTREDERSCPRWQMIEAWTIAAHGPHMAAAGGFRLAFWREEADHHGPRLERALERYGRYAEARPPSFPAGRTAGFAHFLTHHVQHQDGAERGMAYDVARFNQLTKQMAAYAHAAGDDYRERAAARARRRQHASQLAEQINQRFQFRLSQASDGARLRVASELLDSDYPAHQAAGAKLYAAAMQEQRLAERDQRLLAGEHPGNADGRYQTACAYANRWGLPTPSARRASSSASESDERL